MPLTYTQRRIDGTLIELMPDGALQVRPERAEPFTLAPDLAHALYLFYGLPGIAPAVRQHDAHRQQRIFETKYGEFDGT